MVLVVVVFVGIQDAIAVGVFAQKDIHVRAVKQAQFIHCFERIALAHVRGLLHRVVSHGWSVGIGIAPIEDGLVQVHGHARQPVQRIARSRIQVEL